jgi:hypothetical protein
MLRVSPEDAVVSIDGSDLEGHGSSRELFLDPGSRTLTIHAPRHREQTIRLSLLSGATVQTEVTLVADSPVDPELRESEQERRVEQSMASRPTDTAPADEPSLFESPVFWAVAGVVVVGAGVGIGIAAASSGDEAAPPYGGSSGVVIGLD